MEIYILGIALLLGISGGSGPRVATDSVVCDQERASSGQEASRIDFRLIKISDGKSDEKHWFKEFEIEASNGHSLSWEHDMLSTPAAASRQLQRFSKRAAEILRRNPEVDSGGRVVG